MQPLELARHFIAAVEAGDVETARACFAPHAEIWHNFDGASQTVDENLAVLRWMMRRATRRSYEITRLEEIPGGYLQQHLLRVTDAAGREHVVPACAVVTLEGGRIRRIEEYLDPTPLGALR